MENSTDKVLREIGEPQAASETEKLQVSRGSVLKRLFRFYFALTGEFFCNVDLRTAEPGWIEYGQVIGVYARSVSFP